jgi:hypothetical protein
LGPIFHFFSTSRYQAGENGRQALTADEYQAPKDN